MRKKALEKIPYIGAREIKDKKIDWIVKTALQELETKGEPEKYLFVELYKNKKQKLKVPEYRFVLGEKECAYYMPKASRWHTGRIMDRENDYWDICIFDKRSMDKNFVKAGRKEQSEIKQYVKGIATINTYNKDKWWRLVHSYQKHIGWEITRRENERKEQELNDLLAETPPQRKGMQIWAKKNLYPKSIMFYEVKGNRAVLTCGECGETNTFRLRTGNESYEELFFGSRITRPRKDASCICKSCSAVCRYDYANRPNRSELRRIKYLYDIQKLRSGKVVIRYIGVTREIAKGSAAKYDFYDVAFNWFEEHKSAVKRGFGYWSYTEHKVCYHYNNFSGCEHIVQSEERIYLGGMKTLKKSFLKYCGLETFQRNTHRTEIELADYMTMYVRHPEIELLLKRNLTGLVLRQMEWGDAIKGKASCIEEALGIRKEHMHLLEQEKGDWKMALILRMEKETGVIWKEADIMDLYHMTESYSLGEIKDMLRFMTLRKLLNRICRYAGVEPGQDFYCERACAKINTARRKYRDYLHMRETQGYDMTNSIYLYPKDLDEAHDKMVLEQEKERLDKRKQEVRKLYPKIAEQYKKLNKEYEYHRDGFLIRPAKEAGEIVMEGRLLHHCVGGDGYLHSHNNGKSYILFLREETKQEEPHITVEIEPKKKQILQWYGAYDKKPDEEFFDKWLEDYVLYLKNKKKRAGKYADRPATKETMKEQLLQAAG